MKEVSNRVAQIQNGQFDYIILYIILCLVASFCRYRSNVLFLFQLALENFESAISMTK